MIHKLSSFSRRRFIQATLKGFALPVLMQAWNNNALAAGPVKAESLKENLTDLEAIKNLLKSKKPSIWVFAGDSITQGAKHTKGIRSYSEVFTERVRWEMGRPRDFIINTAVSGNTSTDVINDFDWRVAYFKPNVVSLMIGTNDAAINKNISVETFEKNIEKLIEKIREAGAVPLLQTPNPIVSALAKERAQLPAYVKVLRKVAEQHKVVLIDHYLYWEEAARHSKIYDTWLNDPLHPNGVGHLQMAQMIFKALSIYDPKSFTCMEKI